MEFWRTKEALPPGFPAPEGERRTGGRGGGFGARGRRLNNLTMRDSHGE